ncbi:hypothetical protein N7452_002982 [Penicillium brevicompactum]|uniref:Uncharacterized protein n=1 Tax=Penicillium brevicompactum TaxID=5074 RepID=A0A9W9UKA0_PENBR|nr:hypothetical protein N7452_002982 [Penicillium brevicompactum]
MAANNDTNPNSESQTPRYIFIASSDTKTSPDIGNFQNSWNSQGLFTPRTPSLARPFQLIAPAITVHSLQDSSCKEGPLSHPGPHTK